MQIFYSHPVTREFIAQGVADPDPIERGNWLIPAYAYPDPPPKTPDGQVAIRDEEDISWQVVPDFRGPVYSTETGVEIEWDMLGELPEDLTASPRPSVFHHWHNGAWVVDLAVMHKSKSQEINLACESAITANFSSSALGTSHQYSSQLDDQLNLTGAILRGLDMPYACRDEQGVKAFRLHTAEQLRQVGDDFTVYKLQLLQRANELKQQLDLALAAGDAEAMQAITWEGAGS